MELFFQANCELEKISVWFKANKVSLNVGKYIFLKKKSQIDSLPSMLPNLFINGSKIEREVYHKFFSRDI